MSTGGALIASCGHGDFQNVVKAVAEVNHLWFFVPAGGPVLPV